MTQELGVQSWNAEKYAQLASYVPELGQSVLDLLDPKPGLRILDLGCGSGDLTQKILDAGAEVVGVDASQSMVDHACGRGIDARLCDARELPFEHDFDAVFSNAVLHWIKDHKPVLRGVHKALKPSGRFVAEFGGFGNVAAITSTLIAVLSDHGFPGRSLNPWYNPSVSGYQSELEAAGFDVSNIDLIWRPTPIPQGMAEWLDMFAAAFFKDIQDEELVARMKLKIVDALEPNLRDESGLWYADHVRLRFVAIAS